MPITEYAILFDVKDKHEKKDKNTLQLIVANV